MTDTLCVRCQRPMPDQAYGCVDCAYRAGDQLHETADMTPAARDIALGFARHGSSGSSGSEPRIPLNLGATQRLDAVQGSLGGWARVISEERGVVPPGDRARDPIVAIAEFLAGHVEWVRHKSFADEFLTDVEACARVVRSIARGPSEQKYLGPCGAPILTDVEEGCPVNCACHNGPHYACDEPGGCGSAGCGQARPTGEICFGVVRGPRGAESGHCGLCGTRYEAGERTKWLEERVREYAFTARQIVEGYGDHCKERFDYVLVIKTIRTWANRGQLRTYWRTEDGIVAAWTDPPDGEERERLHYVGDVLDLAAADAGRRATEQAKRARRREQRDQGEAA